MVRLARRRLKRLITGSSATSPAVVHVGGGTAQAGEHRLVVAEHQQVRLGAVPEMEMDALFGTEALDEMQVAFVVLHAVFALGIPGAELEAVGVGEDAVLLEDQGDDLRHREVLEDPLVVALGEVGQVWDEGEAIAGQALAEHRPVRRCAPGRGYRCPRARG